MRLSQELDLGLVIAVAMAASFGVTMIFSAAGGSALWRSQALFAVLGLLLMVLVVYVPNRVFYDLAYPAFGAALVLLVVVLFWGTGDPARRLSLTPSGALQFQPSEFAKTATVLAMARYLADQSPERMGHPRVIAGALLLAALPMALVAREPDLGTSIAYPAALLPMLYWAGLRPLHIFFLVAPFLSVAFSFEELWQDQTPIVFALFIIVSSVVIQLLLSRLWVTLSLLALNLSSGLVTVYLWKSMLHDYQKARILTFLDPERDALGAGWNIIQSKIAIGSGGLLGKGYLEGTQTKYEFLPAAHTDFIFSVVGEELGFVGAVAVLALFLFLIWRALAIATMSSNRFYSLLAIGLASMLTFHLFINVGMTIGVMPVTGLPLPFLSYGGTALVANWMAVGLLLHAYASRHEY